MENRVLYRMIQELRQQCQFAQMAFQNVRTCLNEQSPERAFLHAHAFLYHALAISRFLWPVRPESSERGALLRSELTVGAESALRLTGFREQIEQPDEVFEDWLRSLNDPNYVDMNLMPAGTLTGFKTDAFHRSLDPDTFKLRLRGATCDLRSLHDEIHQVETTIQKWMRTHNPW